MRQCLWIFAFYARRVYAELGTAVTLRKLRYATDIVLRDDILSHTVTVLLRLHIYLYTYIQSHMHVCIHISKSFMWKD